MINTILFDLDDTLYSEKDFVFGGFKEICIYLSNKYGSDFSILYDDIKRIFNEHGRGRIFNLLCEMHNFEENIKKLIDIYRNSAPDIKLYEDSIYILKKLRNKYNLGIITDGKASVQWNKIKLLRLEEYVDKIIATDDYGLSYWKPNKFAYVEMLNYFNSSPSQSIYIGDNPNKDFIGAKELGLHTVRIIRECGDHISTFLSKDYEADYNIYNLIELERIVEILSCQDV